VEKEKGVKAKTCFTSYRTGEENVPQKGNEGWTEFRQEKREYRSGISPMNEER